jgi:hypothetical protein
VVWDPAANVVRTVAEYPCGTMCWDNDTRSSWDVNFTFDIYAIVTSSRVVHRGGLSLELREWSRTKVKWNTTLTGAFAAFWGPSCVISADGSTVAVTTTKLGVTIFATLDGSVIRRVAPIPREIRSMYCHPAYPTLIAIHYMSDDEGGSNALVYDWMNGVVRYQISSEGRDLKFSGCCNNILL